MNYLVEFEILGERKYTNLTQREVEGIMIIVRNFGALISYTTTCNKVKIVFRKIACRGRTEVAGLTTDRQIRVRFPAYPHHVWGLWWQEGKRRLRTSRCPGRGRLGTLKIPSCPWRWVPTAGLNLETGQLSCHYIAEILLNVKLNHN